MVTNKSNLRLNNGYDLWLILLFSFSFCSGSPKPSSANPPFILKMNWWVSMPKVELHAHLNGSIRDSTLMYVFSFSWNTYVCWKVFTTYSYLLILLLDSMKKTDFWVLILVFPHFYSCGLKWWGIWFLYMPWTILFAV